MLEWLSTMDVLEARPEYADAVRCMIDMEMSNPLDGYYVIVPGVFQAKGKPAELTVENWFEPSIIGTVYGDDIPEEWLLVGLLHAKSASSEQVGEALSFVAERNAWLIENKS